jgi:hypothetical protein
MKNGSLSRFSVRGEVPLVERHVLDAHDALIRFQLRDAIDQQEWKAMRQYAFDGAVIQRQSQ